MRTIVVGVDGSGESIAALRTAASRARRGGMRLRVVHAHRLPLVFAGSAASVAMVDPDGQRQAEALLRDALGAADLHGVAVEQRVVGCSTVGRALVEEAASADLLVVGAVGADRARGLRIGSVSEHVARHASCSVLVVPAGGGTPDGPVVVGVDGSPGADLALRCAAREAAREGRRVDVVHAYRPYTPHRPFGAEFMEAAAPGASNRLEHRGREVVEAALERAAVDRSAVRVEVHVVPGHPADALAAAAAGASILVVGARGHGGFGRILLGSVAYELLRRPEVPLLVVRGRGSPTRPSEALAVGNAASAAGQGSSGARSHDTI